MISLRYVQRLLEGEGLTWTSGEWVEGYSNLGWVLMTAGLGLFGIDLVVATRLLGLAALCGVIALVSLGPDGRPDAKRALSGGVFAAGICGLGIWAMAGLAQTFVAMMAVAGVLAARLARDTGDRRAVAGLIAVLAVMTVTRIDGFVLAGCVLVGAVAGGLPWRTAGWAALGPAVVWGAQQAFRLAYYGDWVSNTARVKVSFTLGRAVNGATWVGKGLWDHAPLGVAALVALLVLRRRVLDALVAALVWCAFCAYVGGDIFAGYRLMLPALPLLALMVADLGSHLSARLVPVLTALGLGLYVWNVDIDFSTRVPTEDDHWVLRTVGPAEALRGAFAKHDPLLAVDAAGALPYYTRFRSVDMLGLTDRFLATHPPPGWGSGGLGHDLGNGTYIWNRKPDILAFRAGTGGPPMFISGKQMEARRDWGMVYRPVFVVGPDPQDRPTIGFYYLRAVDSKLGMTRTDDRIDAPGYFFTTGRSPAVLRGDVLGPLLDLAHTHPITLGVPKGRWRVTVDADGPVAVQPAEVEHGGGPLTVQLVPTRPGVQLRSVRYDRVR
ncbi:MAG: hypothetical protein R3F61_23475 [Myxococcota bacterium]